MEIALDLDNFVALSQNIDAADPAYSERLEQALADIFAILQKNQVSTPLANRVCLATIADSQLSSKVRQAAFAVLSASAPKTEPHYIAYCAPQEIAIVKEVPGSIYAEIVKSMTISCVDTFVYNFEQKAYLMVLRTTPPEAGKWWFPGGRIFKGESFYESAARKTKKESGLDICPIAQLGTYSTYFSESAWGDKVHTDTKNTVVLALCDNKNAILDEHHEAFQWVSIDTPPTDPYLLSAYEEAKATLAQMNF